MRISVYRRTYLSSIPAMKQGKNKGVRRAWKAEKRLEAELRKVKR